MLNASAKISEIFIYAKDFAKKITHFFIFYGTPIVYTIDKLNFSPDSWQTNILRINPLYGIIDMFRAAVLHGDEFMAYLDINALIYCSIFAVAVFIIGVGLFYKFQDKFILHI